MVKQGPVPRNSHHIRDLHWSRQKQQWFSHYGFVELPSRQNMMISAMEADFDAYMGFLRRVPLTWVWHCPSVNGMKGLLNAQ